MEIELSSYPLNSRERFYSQSLLVLFLALGLVFWGNWVVLANPSTSGLLGEDSRVPLSERVFESSGEWRAPQKPKKKWRQSKEKQMTLEKGRIKKGTASLYNPSMSQDNWDPYSSTGHPDNLTKPAKVFEFKF